MKLTNQQTPSIPVRNHNDSTSTRHAVGAEPGDALPTATRARTPGSRRRSRQIAGALLLGLSSPLLAFVTFGQLDSNTFTVSHMVKGIGNKGKATRQAYEKAASVCVAAGYSHLKFVNEQADGTTYGGVPNATVTFKLFNEPSDDRIECAYSASPEHVVAVKKKLAKRGYDFPSR